MRRSINLMVVILSVGLLCLCACGKKQTGFGAGDNAQTNYETVDKNQTDIVGCWELVSFVSAKGIEDSMVRDDSISTLYLSLHEDGSCEIVKGDNHSFIYREFETVETKCVWTIENDKLCLEFEQGQDCSIKYKFGTVALKGDSLEIESKLYLYEGKHIFSRMSSKKQEAVERLVKARRDVLAAYEIGTAVNVAYAEEKYPNGTTEVTEFPFGDAFPVSNVDDKYEWKVILGEEEGVESITLDGYIIWLDPNVTNGYITKFLEEIAE